MSPMSPMSPMIHGEPLRDEKKCHALDQNVCIGFTRCSPPYSHVTKYCGNRLDGGVRNRLVTPF